jgi:exonuclease III
LQVNRPKKQAGVAILKFNKIDFHPKVFKRNRKRHFRVIKGKFYQDDVSILNIYAPNERALTFTKEALLKFKSCNKPHTLILGDYNIPLSPRSSRQILSREIMNLTDFMNQMNLTDI